MYPLIRPLLFTLSPEKAHQLTLATLATLHRLRLTRLLKPTPQLPRTVMGLPFPNPVGLAAGMDKNAEYLSSLATLGFGFIEVGTVTPRPQSGNPKPRLFRLPKAQALINRMGFNNIGLDNFIHHLRARQFQGILGVNLGKNADTSLDQAASDYLIGLHRVYPFADYVTINISSPNTPQLRQLQYGYELERLLDALKQAQYHLSQTHHKYVPLVIKIAPEFTTEALALFAATLLNYQIDGVIATNTTLSRPGLESTRYADEAGGLSGAPLAALSTQVVQQLSTLLQGQIPIIASGGVMSAQDAQQK
ncbi:MAG: dihydroorotate dehydrogenase (quinone), partial [Pseudomonadota bacterium]|nr:dihydroorotate dehydrogenase (quinone) [Pseudomonadota bacterium]